MNGIDKISEQIMADAKAKADAILADAQTAAAEIGAKAALRIERDNAAAEAAAAVRVADITEKGRLLASSEGKKRMASERQSLISAVFDKALEALIHLPSAEYRALLISLAQSAVEDGEGGELLLNAHDRAEHGEAVLKELNARLMGDKVSRAGEVVRDVIGHVLSGKKPSAEQLLGGAADAISGRLLTLADDTAPIVGGVVVRRGRIEINCALDVIVRMLSEEAAFEVSNALFGKGE